jgi:hypothetical protein
VYFRFAARGAAELQRAPLLERLLARADSSGEPDWRAAAFRRICPSESMPAVAAAALYAELGAVDGTWVFMATPVHYVAATSSVRLPREGVLQLEQSEARELAADFSRLWRGGGLKLVAGTRGTLYCVFDKPMQASTEDPQAVLGRDIWDFLPTGADAPELRRVMSEIEMWLFEHAVNRVRAVRAAADLSGLWLWGGGAMLPGLPPLRGWTAGGDALFGAFPARSQFLCGAGAGVVVLDEVPGSAQWPEAESRWLRPALAELRAGRIAHVDLSAGHRCHRLSAHWNWRFWRRTRPWWESFDED